MTIDLKMDKEPSHGGVRENSGRKPKLKDEARQMFYAAVDARWEMIMEKIDYYIQKGDKDILKMIIEQRIGKAPQPIEVEGEIRLKIDM